MAKAVALYTGGINFLIERAVRADGVVFNRYQSRGPYGYVWSKWQRSGTVNVADLDSLPRSEEAGFSTLFRQYPSSEGRKTAYFNEDGTCRYRLPN